jgi:hypothetical protein
MGRVIIRVGGDAISEENQYCFKKDTRILTVGTKQTR